MITDKYRGLPAISYARASLGKGKGQDLSTDRQTMLTIEYCEKLGLNLDLNFRIIDEGVSAFKQIVQIDEYGRKTKIAKNLSESALADFVQIVRGGRFPDGVNLIIEKLDRMYRDVPRIALEHFTSLLNNGVTIHTLTDNKIYSPDSKGMESGMDLFQSIMEMVASHNYSKILSGRLKDSVKLRVKEMQEDPTKFYKISRLPDWVEFEKNEIGKSIAPFVSEKNKLLIQRIYEMYLQGNSTKHIARKLNNEDTRNFQNELWSSDTVTNLLQSRSVLGIYTPVKGVEIFRKELLIISNSDWHLVQEIMQSKTAKGKKSPDNQIFSGLLCCGYCLHRKKRYAGRPYTNSPLTYRGSGSYNKRFLPMEEDTKLWRSYICKSGEVSSKNCSNKQISYYHIYDSFFSFVKDLDFSSLVDTKSKVQDKVLQRKLLEIKAEIAEIEIKINDQKRLLPLLKNENQLKDIAQEIDNLSFEKDEKLKSLEDAQLVLQEYNNQKKEFIQSEAEIKELISKASNDNVYFALRKKVVYYNPRKSKKHKEQNKKFTSEELKEKKDIDRLWNIAKDIIDAIQADDKELASNLIAEEESLLQKHFAKEVELDEQGLEIKSKINNELRKFIKNIKVYSYGFAVGEPTKPFDDRKGASLMDKHLKDIRAFVEENNGNLDYLKPKRDSGWMHSEIEEALGIARTTYRRFLRTKKLPNYANTHKCLTPLFEKLKKTKSKAYGLIEKKEFSKFLGYSIEFTDLCKPDVIKYVLPYYKDYRQGISFDFNTRTGKAEFGGSFGEKEIKISRNEFAHSKYNKEDLFILSDDPVYHKSFTMMFNHIGKTLYGADGFKYGESIVNTGEKPKDITEEDKEYIERRIKDMEIEGMEDNI